MHTCTRTHAWHTQMAWALKSHSCRACHSQYLRKRCMERFQLVATTPRERGSSTSNGFATCSTPLKRRSVERSHTMHVLMFVCALCVCERESSTTIRVHTHAHTYIRMYVRTYQGIRTNMCHCKCRSSHISLYRNPTQGH